METDRLEAFISQWEAWYPSTPPVGYLLRDAQQELWLRIHSLPGGKRRATTERDKEELIRRHRMVAQALRGQSPTFVAISAAVTPPERVPVLRKLGFVHAAGWVGRYKALSEDLSDTLQPFEFYVAEDGFDAGRFSEIVIAVADDLLDPILFVNPQDERVYAPYEGGADLFTRTVKERDRLRELFRSCLSPRPDGM